MIELQDDGIAQPALHAWVLAQKLGDKDAIRFALKRVVPLIALQIRAPIVHVVLPRTSRQHARQRDWRFPEVAFLNAKSSIGCTTPHPRHCRLRMLSPTTHYRTRV